MIAYFQSLTKADLEEVLYPISIRLLTAKLRGADPSSPEVLEKARKQARVRSRQIFQWVYQRMVTDFDQMSDLALDVRKWLAENYPIYRLTESYGAQSNDGTRKFLWSLADRKTIESVIIPAALSEKDDVPDNDHGIGVKGHVEGQFKQDSSYAGEAAGEALDSGRWGRLTACISSQVGCAMGCRFCLTGIQGLDRNLETHEVVAQIHELRRVAPISNIVFMGMGEPLNNLENIIKACRIFLDQDAFNFSKRKITVSTSGLVPAIIELGQTIDVNLAVSLNATTDEIRSQIMPVNKKWNLDALLTALRQYPLGPHRRITLEYVMLAGINDSLDDAKRLLQLTRSIPNKINLIPFNQHPGSDYKRPSDAVVKQFHQYLVDRKVTATVRISRGRDILAACGQLRSIFGTARGTEKHRDFKPTGVPNAPKPESSLNSASIQG